MVPPRWHGDDSPAASAYSGGEGYSEDGYGSSADEASQAQAAWHGAQPGVPSSIVGVWLKQVTVLQGTRGWHGALLRCMQAGSERR